MVKRGHGDNINECLSSSNNKHFKNGRGLSAREVGLFWSVCARVSGLSRDQDKAGGVDYIDDIARRKEVDLCHEHSLHSQSVIQSHMMSNFSLSGFH